MDDYNKPSVHKSLLSLPAEVRNIIYDHIFAPEPIPRGFPQPSPRDDMASSPDIDPISRTSPHALPLVCRQLAAETSLLNLSRTNAWFSSKSVDPPVFAAHFANLSPRQERAVRSITLHASISQLRALNERWDGLPFGHPALHLDNLTLIPQRPVAFAPHAEVGDLSQLHSLSYLLGETIKSLRHVKTITVVNQGCFTELLWRLVYGGLIYRIWRWAGEGAADSGLAFREVDGRSCFQICLDADLARRCVGGLEGKVGCCPWRDATEEIERLTGATRSASSSSRTPFHM